MSAVAPENIDVMSVTFEVSKFERSRVVRERALSNIEFMLVTFEVLKLERFSVASESVSLNIKDIFVTLDVSKFVRSREVRRKHPKTYKTYLSHLMCQR